MKLRVRNQREVWTFTALLTAFAVMIPLVICWVVLSYSPENFSTGFIASGMIIAGTVPLLITPPFPEYPSGHSSESGAAAEALTAMFGDNFAFEDATHVREGLKARPFKSFWAAAEEAGISRLYGGIHFRAAIEQGLAQGRCIGKLVAALDMR